LFHYLHQIDGNTSFTQQYKAKFCHNSTGNWHNLKGALKMHDLKMTDKEKLWVWKMQEWKMTDNILANSQQNYGVWKCRTGK